MNVKLVQVFKVDIPNGGISYEEGAKRAYAWALFAQFKKSGRDNPNFSDCLAIIENIEDFKNILDEYYHEYCPTL